MFKLFEEEELRRGVCLDGTAPAYYFRPGFGDGRRKFVIYYEGRCKQGDEMVQHLPALVLF
eukprot:18667-Eustigmatos_ZCMA.PRE.1